MSQSSPHLISIRAIEDIIQIQKNNEKLPKVIESEILKDKIEDADHSFTKHGPCSTFAENHISLPKVIEGTVTKRSDIKIRKRIEGNGSEGDYQNSEFIHLDDVKLIEKADSEFELKSWPSDSDITIIRMKKEYRKELSTRMIWEEERNLTESRSSMNFDWESHSLINLANITTKEKDDAERLTPFTIWSKTGNSQSESECTDETPDNKYSNVIIDQTSNISLTLQSENKTNHTSDEFAMYEAVSSCKNPSGQSFYKHKIDMLPILDDQISKLYRTESSLSVHKESIQEKVGKISDFSESGTKRSHSGKLKLLRSFFSFFSKCGSKKSSLPNNN